MRKYFIYTIIILFVTNSCQDFLDVRAVGAVDENTLANEYGVDLAITGMYATFHQTGYFHSTLSNYAYGDVMGVVQIKDQHLMISLTLLTWKPIVSQLIMVI